MWFFKRKKRDWQSRTSNLSCSFCRGTNTEIKAHYNSDQPDYIKIWRGRRYITCRCLECGRDFYIETTERAARGLTIEERLVDDEEELRVAEEELKKQIDDEGDRRYR